MLSYADSRLQIAMHAGLLGRGQSADPRLQMQIAASERAGGCRAGGMAGGRVCRSHIAAADLARGICRVKSADSHLSCSKITTLSLQIADFCFLSDYRWNLQGAIHGAVRVGVKLCPSTEVKKC